MAVQYVDLKEAFTKLDYYTLHGAPEGLSCGWSTLDPFFKLSTGQLNVVSGFPSSGKSEWVENIACYCAKKYKWKILMYSPESYPSEDHAQKLIERISGFSYFGKSPIDINSKLKAEKILLDQFTIVSADDDPYSFSDITSNIEDKAKQGIKYDMVIIDPWNELEATRPAKISETDWIGECLMKARRLARKYGSNWFIVAHPSKPEKKNKSGEYDPPDLYDISGSSHWRNKCDNGFIVHRFSLVTTQAMIFIKKIKKRRYGKMGQVPLDFDVKNGRYIPIIKQDSFL